MSLALNLVFPDPDHVIIQSGTGFTQPLDFSIPLKAQALNDIRWYLEVYSAQYTADVDDDRAARIEANLPQWGTELFNAVLGQFAAQTAFSQFYQQKQPGRVLTIGASHPDILALPWELLHVPNGNFLFTSNPRISIRRQFNTGGSFNLTEYQPKETVRILFIISRPDNAGFIDPRSDAQAVLSAIAAEGDGRVEVEFLRPATMEALLKRLDDRRLPAIDIVHFDGHGVYDPSGAFFEEARRSDGLDLTRTSAAEAADMGYLLFEDADSKRALISAEKLAAVMNEQTVGLVVLSACQSAMVGLGDSSEEDPTKGIMGSVAARLTHAGIPAVLAMTHSVLVATTRELFGQFYQNLGKGYGMGESLDNARRYLYLHTERGTRIRGQQQEVTLKLQDWFLPALYQAGADTPLLLPEAEAEMPAADSGWGNLPELQEAGFWGRSRELWQIERAFVRGTRRVSIVGFGGQGKTYLAQEAGRWLHQTGLFERVCFVDYAEFQGVDAVGLAVSTLATVLQQSLVNAEAARAALAQRPTLLILDNLETLSAQALQALLEAACGWSEAGQSRLLLTSRQPEFHHAEYKVVGSRRHIRLQLRGLGSEAYPDDALRYFQALMQLPPEPQVPLPERSALVALFKLVDFHPLSIGLLAQQLKVRRVAELGSRLERLLAEIGDEERGREGDIGNPLVASLRLSLDRLGPEAQRWLPRLGVFQGGAFEDDLLAITGLGLTPQQAQQRELKRAIERLQRGESVSAEAQWRQLLQLAQEQPEALSSLLEQLGDVDLTAGADETTWPTLRQALVVSGLMQPEQIPGIGVPYLKFHPTLAPLLWAQLSEAEQARLLARHRQRYYQLSGYLYQQDRQNPGLARAIVRRELPNLLMAVNGALAAGDENSVDFVNNVNKFLDYFGLSKDRDALLEKLTRLTGEVGSRDWYLARSNQGEALFSAGRLAEAAQVSEEILAALGETPSYERCLTLGRLGRCFQAQGQAAQAANCYRQGLAVAVQLAQSDGVKREQGALQGELADVLTAMGDYAGAKASYEASLDIFEVLGDLRNATVARGQLGTLALAQGDLPEATKQHQAALQTFRQLGELASEAVAWHQLGRVYQEAGQWNAAEQHYREAARIEEARGDLAGAAQTWNQLALVNKKAGRVQAAIAWYEKALDGFKKLNEPGSLSKVLTNLADLLQTQCQPADLAAARQYA
ncbi:MAG: tetratricopeptide repeat protein, partial [Leptolyngbya sp. SIO4C1]|nr:tetratricopeptide repeat protein [Leptolyngbya sp. SIO4C1]